MTHYSPRQRQVIELIAREELTQREVGNVLGIHLSTVKVHIARIKERSGLSMKPQEVIRAIYRSWGHDGDTC